VSISDFNLIIWWWLIIFLLGTLSLPICFRLFPKFHDLGYIFSKIISIIILSYTIFIFGIFKLVPFTQPALFSVIAIFVFLELFFLSKNNNFQKFKEKIFDNRKIFITEELLFLIILIAWSYVRSFAPDIEGLEKFMDWGFVNSILRSKYMPPLDMWYTGKYINYYYFGHLMFAVLTKVSTINSAITYNLSIATVCALTFVSSFSLSSNLVHALSKKANYLKIFSVGLISALLLTFGGNLHSVYKISKIIIQNEGKFTLNGDAVYRAVGSYWYPDATRFIGFDPDIQDKTIHEFPIYSFVVADLHGHMNDIPVVMLLLALLFSVVEAKYFFIIFGFGLSIAFMTNAWDFAVYGLVFSIFYFLLKLSKENNFFTAFNSTFFKGISIIILWYIFTLPFSLNFIPMAEGLKIADSHSLFYQLFILYGGFWLINLPLFIYFTLNFYKNKLSKADLFVFALQIIATTLIIIPELIYLKDIYIFEHRRANTMFKLVYQAFMMYSLISGYAVYRLSQILKGSLKLIYLFIFLLVFIIHLIYPYFAINSYYGYFKNYQGLWGLNFLKTNFEDNLKLIDWMNNNIQGQPVILEAVGDSYTTYNQVSVATGLPTVEGWIVHEWLWRGGYDGPAGRQTDVVKMYESTNLSELKKLLTKYSVKYVVIGVKEKEKYKNLNEDSIKKIGKIIFESGETRLYEVNY